jgi:hypothetical protein
MANPDHPIHQFIADCEKLLTQHGKPAGQFVNGSLYRDALVFDTPGLNIAKGPGQELEISIKYINDRGSVTDNPVVCRAENGDIYRTHGEWSFGRKRVARLLAGETPDTPIALGKGESGWTEGLD